MQVGDHAQHRPAGVPQRVVQGRPEQARVAAEAIDHPAGHQLPLPGGQHFHRADEGGEDPAAVDVADDQHGRPACRAIRMLTMSWLLRLTSPGEPAPSSTTASNSAARLSYDSQATAKPSRL